MFWEEPFSLEAAEKACQEHWGVSPRPLWAQTEVGPGGCVFAVVLDTLTEGSSGRNPFLEGGGWVGG